MLLDRDGIDIGRIGAVGQVGPGAPGLIDEALQQEVRALDALVLQHGLQGIEPFLGLLGIDVGLVAHGPSLQRSTRAAGGGAENHDSIAVV